MPEAPSPIELRQSTSNLLGLPILIAVVIVAIVISQLAHGTMSVAIVVVCAAAAVLDGIFAAYLLRNMGSTLVVSRDEITFTRRQGNKAATSSVIRRSDRSSLSFRTGRNGPFGSQYTGYILKLRDDATGQEVFAGAFGRRRVRQACEAQGWAFS